MHEELDVVYKALAERESDLQVAAQIGQSLLGENQKLTTQVADAEDSQKDMKKIKAKLAQLVTHPSQRRRRKKVIKICIYAYITPSEVYE